MLDRLLSFAPGTGKVPSPERVKGTGNLLGGDEEKKEEEHSPENEKSVIARH